jgi:hypothetical protein
LHWAYLSIANITGLKPEWHQSLGGKTIKMGIAADFTANFSGGFPSVESFEGFCQAIEF